ncbi:MAG TPA: hypothetical protein PLW81_03680 [Thiobacillaceae bacterium]|nr:hypothetical protein [Thiobacillaceae bacterium]
MTRQNGKSQYAQPFWISSLDHLSSGQPLGRIEFNGEISQGADKYDESWLQRLLYQNPTSLPIGELEQVGNLISAAREVQTPAGYIDNVYVTAEGNIVLVECKLWRNPESRRRVIAQIIDYAQSIAHWSFDDFDLAIRKGLDANDKPIGRPLVEIVAEATGGSNELDEARFIDAIQRNLRLGRILLLVVGDGIREDTESLANYLQMHAGFHFTLGLIEVAIFKTPSQGLIVQPRILARTLNIERAVVRLASDSLAAEAIVDQGKAQLTSRRMTMTEELFFENLEAASPETAAALRDFLSQASELAVFLDPATKSASLKWDSPDGKTFNLGGVDMAGRLMSYAVGWVPNSIGKIALGHEYLAGLSEIVGGSVKHTKDKAQWYVTKNGAFPMALDALSKPGAWLDLIKNYQDRLTKSGVDV